MITFRVRYGIFPRRLSLPRLPHLYRSHHELFQHHKLFAGHVLLEFERPWLEGM
jgi:hypothetical protein